MDTTTIILIAITAATSLYALQNEALMNRLILYPHGMKGDNAQYYRLLTSGFIHSDMNHLFFNMLALYFFGPVVSRYYEFSGLPVWAYPAMYLSAIVVASLPSYLKNIDNPSYMSLGASGGVGAVIFASIYFSPWSTILVWFFPMPAVVFAVGYLIYSAYASRKGIGNINHDAHFWGSVFGFVVTIAIVGDHGANFLQDMLHPRF
jgi:membrane associated rhomboid family serine protease